MECRIVLRAEDAARNIAREYDLAVHRDLLGALLVVVRSGRIGCPGREIVHVAETPAQATTILRRLLARRASAPKRIGVPYRVMRLRCDEDGRALLPSSPLLGIR